MNGDTHAEYDFDFVVRSTDIDRSGRWWYHSARIVLSGAQLCSLHASILDAILI